MKHWPIKMLGEIATVIRGVSFDKSQVCDLPGRNSIPILRAGNIQDSLLTDSDLIYVPSELVSNEQRMKIGDLAICMSSGSSAIVGKTARLSTNWVGSVGAFCAIIRFNSKINHRFGSYWFRSSAFIQWRDSNAKGANIQNIRRTELERLTLPVPPLAEQERIVHILDEADELRKLRAQADRRTANLIPALFHEMFGDPIANPNRWQKIPLAEAGKLDRGRSKNRPRDDSSLYGGKYPFIQTGDVAQSNGLINSYTQTYSEKGLAQSRMWPAGTLCITIAANIGKTAILTFPACFPDSLVGFVPGDKVVVDYVRQWLVTMENSLEEAAPQMAQKNINLKILSKLQIPIPPLSLQNEFTQRVAEIRDLETDQAKSKSHLDAIFHSLLHRAFEGE